MKKYMGKYSKKQISFVLGTILGDSYITKFRPKRANSYLECLHSNKQIKLLEYKKKRLLELGFNVSEIKEYKNGDDFKRVMFNCTDVKLFNQLRLVLYPKNNKSIKRKWLNWLDKEGLALWFMDDGSYTKRGNSGYISLHTNGFNYHEHKILIKYFKQVWNISPTLKETKKKDRDITYFLTFNVEETKKLVEIIEPYIIPSMKYKVGFEFKEHPENG